MDDPQHQTETYTRERTVSVLGFIVALTGVLVLLGWFFDIRMLKSVLPGFVAMKANTAICFVLAGSALALHAQGKYSEWKRIVFYLAVAIIGFVGITTLCEYAFDWNAGIDELVFQDDPGARNILGRMSPITAMNFILTGFALVFSSMKGERSVYAKEFVIILILLLSIVSVIEYVYEIQLLFNFHYFTRPALHTLVVFVLLAYALVRVRASQGLIGTLQLGMTGKLERSVYRTFILSFIIVLVGFISLITTNESITRSNRVDHTNQVRRELTKLLSLLQDMETGSRGYTITGSDEYLEPFREATKVLEAQRNILRSLIAEHPSQAYLMDELSRYIDAKVLNATSIVDLQMRGNRQAAIELVQSGVGKHLMDSVRVFVERMDTVENTLLFSRRQEEARSVTRLKITIVAGFLLSISIISFSIVVVHRDFKKRKQAEDALYILNAELDDRVRERTKALEASEHSLRVAEKKYRTLFEKMQEGFALHEVLCDKNGNPIDYRFIEINDAFQTMTGLRREDIIGKTIREVIPQIETEWIVKYGDVALTGRPISFENYSAPLQKHYSVTAFSPEQYFFATVFTDITERKRSELEVRMANERLQILSEVSQTFTEKLLEYEISLNNMAKKVSESLDAGCTIRLLTNDRKFIKTVAVYNKNPEALASMLETLRHPQDIEEPSSTRRIIQTGESLFLPTVGEMDIPAPANPAYVKLLDRFPPTSVIGVPMRVHGAIIGALFLTRYENDAPPFDEQDLKLAQELADRSASAIRNAQLYQDLQRELAARRIAEDEVRTLNKELEQRVKERTAQLEMTNHELESFSYSVSHDLRAPLRSIDGFSQLLLKSHGATLDHQGTMYLDRVISTCKRMGELIDALLNLSRLSRTTMEYQRVHLSKLVRDISDELRAAQPERIVAFTIADGIEVIGDPRLLRVTIDNLVRNAWKYSRTRVDARIEFGCMEINEERAYFIRDNGVGFDMAYVDKLFGAFQRLHTEEEFEGTGIGLATVARIIHRHGGRIWAEGKVDDGATFYFTIAEKG